MKAHSIHLIILLISMLGFISCHQRTTKKNLVDTTTIDINETNSNQHYIDDNLPFSKNKHNLIEKLLPVIHHVKGVSRTLQPEPVCDEGLQIQLAGTHEL